MTPQRKMLTSGKRLSLTLTEYRRIFPAGWREKFFFGFSGIKKGANLRFYGGLRLAGCLFQSGCMTIRRGAFNVT